MEGNQVPFMRRAAIVGTIVLCAVVVLGLAASYGGSLYYSAGHGARCASCHEMAADVNAVHGSPHHNAQCGDCHEAKARAKLRHVRVHLLGTAPEQIQMREADLEPMMAKCKSCHEHEYAAWHAGPHSATYGEIFTDAKHNGKRRLADDCLRCHGMYFDGAIRDLVQPQNTTGPWRLVRTEMTKQPTMPCMTCHWMHREAPAQSKPESRISVAGDAVKDSLAFYDRREQMHFAAIRLPLPKLHDGARVVTMSPDARQGVCYQCHAPRIPETGTVAAAKRWGMQAGSGDDRTPIGVHEGISCVACHSGHNENARASCATCHPAMSNCGLNVEKMDTTFADAKSAHNIHWVKCADCHTRGVSRVKTKQQTLVGE